MKPLNMQESMVKKHILRIAEKDKVIFEAIKKGTKRVETRAATIKNAQMKTGDVIVCKCGSETIEKKIAKATIFKTISALIKKYKVSDIAPGLSTMEELKSLYARFPGYEDKIKECGIIALELEN